MEGKLQTVFSTSVVEHRHNFGVQLGGEGEYPSNILSTYE